eukprot:6336884-Prorocentrum_lima.AAC.1
MTSSLVGSEMCIRDSIYSQRRADLMEERSQSLQARLWAVLQEAEEQMEPVSYTHLTLPTICSV